GQELEVLAASDAVRRRRPLAHAVHGEDGGLREGRRVEGARGVRLVVLGEEDGALVAAERLADLVAREELLLGPHRHGRQEGAEPARRDAAVVLEQALELEQRLVVEADVVELFRPELPLREAVGDGVAREGGVVLLAREALLLRRRHDLAVADEARRRVVIVGRDAEDGRHGIRTAARSGPGPRARGGGGSSCSPGRRATSGRADRGCAA